MRIDHRSCNVSLLDQVPQYLSNHNSGVSEYGPWLTGYAESLKVSVTSNRVKITKGSLAKYFYSDPFKTLTRHTTQQAIEKLSDSLHLPMWHANITRLDVGQNYEMDHTPELYYNHLGLLQYYERLELPNGLLYVTGTKALELYDKIKQQRKDGCAPPPSLSTKNILRMESRQLKRVPKAFNRASITAADLYDESFYREAVRRFGALYNRINKNHSKMNHLKRTTSTKALVNSLASIALDALDYNEAYKKIKEWQSMGELTKKQAADMRAKLKYLNKLNPCEASIKLMDELDQKVIESIREYQ